MKGAQFINSFMAIPKLVGDLRTAITEYGHVYVRWTTDKPRSIDQNAISHSWYMQIADELREDSTVDVKCQCKLYFGVPILRAEDADFCEMYDAIIKGRTYEEKLAIMKYLPITSLMTTAQLSQYLDAMQLAYGKRGVSLEFPQ